MLDLPLVLWNAVPQHSVVDAAFFPSAGRLFTASAEGQICLWILEDEVDASAVRIGSDSDEDGDDGAETASDSEFQDAEDKAPQATTLKITPAAILCTPDCHRVVALGSGLTAMEKEFKEVLLSIEEDGSIAKWSINEGRCMERHPKILPPIPQLNCPVATLLDQRKVAISPCGADIYIVGIPNMKILQILRMGCERVAALSSIVLENKSLSTVSFVAVDYTSQITLWQRSKALQKGSAEADNNLAIPVHTWNLNWGSSAGKDKDSNDCFSAATGQVEAPRAVSVVKSFDSSIIVVMEKRRFGVFSQLWLHPDEEDVELSVFANPPPPIADPSASQGNKFGDDEAEQQLCWLGALFVGSTTLLVYDSARRTFAVDCSGVAARGSAARTRLATKTKAPPRLPLWLSQIFWSDELAALGNRSPQEGEVNAEGQPPSTSPSHSRSQSSTVHLNLSETARHHSDFQRNHFCFYNDENRRLICVQCFDDVVVSALSLQRWHSAHIVAPGESTAAAGAVGAARLSMRRQSRAGATAGDHAAAIADAEAQGRIAEEVASTPFVKGWPETCAPARGAPKMTASCLVTPVAEPHQLLQLQGFDDGHADIRLYPSRKLIGRLQAPAPTTSVDAVAVMNVGGHGSHLWLFILGGNFGHLHVFIIDMHKFRQQSTNGMMTSDASVSQENRVIHRRHNNHASDATGVLTLKTTLLAHQGGVRLIELFPRESLRQHRQLFCSIGDDRCIGLYAIDQRGEVAALHRFVGHPAEIVRVKWDEDTQVLRVKCRYDPKEYIWDATLSGQMISTREVSHLDGAQDDETASASIAARLGSNPFVVEHSSMPDHYALLADKARISRTRRSSAASSAAVQHAADAAAGAAASIHGGGALPGAGVDRGNGLNTEGTPGPEHTNRLKGSSLHNASVLPKKPKPLEGLVYATDQMLVARQQLVKGVSVGCNLNPHVVFIHVKALMREAHVARKLHRKGARDVVASDSASGEYSSLKEMVLNVLLSYDESNLALDDQRRLFPDHLESRDEVAFGLRGKANCATLLTPSLCSSKSRWCYSGALTALHNLSLTALLLECAQSCFPQAALQSTSGPMATSATQYSDSITRLVCYYASTLPRQLRPHYQDAELAMLAAIGMSSWKTGYVASKLLLQTTVSALPRVQRSNLAGHWAKKLQMFLASIAELGLPESPTLIIDEDTEAEIDLLLLTSSVEDLLNREEIMVLVLSIFGIVNVSDLPPHIAESIVGYLRKFLNCNRDAFLVFGAELLGKGFELWRPFILNTEGLIQKLLILSMIKQNGMVATTTSVRAAAQTALVRIGRRIPGQFISIIERESVREYSEARYHCNAIMALIGLVNAAPHTVHPFLLDIGDMLMAVLDPSESERRKSCIKVAIRALRDMVIKLPMVRFHQATQKLAIGARTGVVLIYDIKAGKRWDILREAGGGAQPAAISCLAFHESGHQIAFYSSGDCSLQVWRIGEGAFGGFGSFLRSRSRCLKRMKVPVITDLGPVLAAGGGLSAVLKLCRMKWTQDQELLLSRENGMNIRVTL